MKLTRRRYDPGLARRGEEANRLGAHSGDPPASGSCGGGCARVVLRSPGAHERVLLLDPSRLRAVGATGTFASSCSAASGVRPCSISQQAMTRRPHHALRLRLVGIRAHRQLRNVGGV